MQADTSPRSPERVSPYQGAIDLAQGCLDRHEEFAIANPGTNSRIAGCSYDKQNLPADGDPATGTPGYEETLEVAGHGGYLNIAHRRRWEGEELLVPRFIDTYTVTADYGVSNHGGPAARRTVFINDGKLYSADYKDYDDSSKSILHNPEDAVDMALFVISSAQESLLSAPA